MLKNKLLSAMGGAPANYIEECFSTYLYTGNSATQTITNGIDLAGEGGAVWIKQRNGTGSHEIRDTVRGSNKALYPNSTIAEGTSSVLSAFTSSGFSLNGLSYNINEAGSTYASWTFRKQPKFFDVVTYTGTGSVQTIAHSLGSVPGSIIVKRTNTTSNWRVYHRSLTSAAYMVELNTSSGEALDNASWNSTAPTSSVFTVGSASEVNASGSTYVAYVFAHDAGGFGLTGSDNVISCGSFTTNGSGVASVNLGYEPQWVVAKPISGGTGSWVIQDNMRGFTASPTVYTSNPLLFANTSDSEATFGASTLQANSTGFTTASATYDPSVTYIYIAIRRGPMKVPTSGTSVFSPIQAAGSTGTKLTTNFPVDLQIWALPGDGGSSKVATDRLRGVSTNTTTSGVSLYTDLTDAENNASTATRYFDNTGYTIPGNFLGSGYNAIYWNFRRAPSFFDEVCWTNNSSPQVNSHNLGVRPELAITKTRNDAYDWFVGANIGTTTFDGYYLNTNAAADVGRSYTSSSAYKGFTATTFTTGGSPVVGAGGFNCVTYLFATCPGVSKVGSYTGTGTTKQIDCGFTGGARFVLIKRTDSTGDWYVWDSARGIVSGNDPYLLLNSAAAEVTNTDYVDTYSAGFEISSTAPAAINASGGTFIFLAIA